MGLHPCASCRRHILADEAACPFCAAPNRLARAAAVTGIALAGCVAQDPPRPVPPPPPTPVVAPHFAQPPADPPPPPPPVARGSISGVVTNSTTGQPAAFAVDVTIESPTMPRQTARTDNAGRYTWTDLAPGTYRITFHPVEHQLLPEPPVDVVQTVIVAEHATLRVDVAVAVPAFVPRRYHRDPRMPYGAPPSRTRLV